MRTLYARTSEIDDPARAVAEILDQPNAGPGLLKNSLGIVSCYAEFIDTGVIAALAEALPFPIVGITTIAAAANGEIGELQLFLTVLTGDDVEFLIGHTEPLAGEEMEPFRKAWAETGAKRPDKPVMMLSFAPLLLSYTMDFYADVWTSIIGDVPNFGSLAVDHNQDYRDSQTIYNGQAFKDRYVFILMYGNLQPQFLVGSIRKEDVFREKGVVTASRGNLLKAVNGVSVGDYLTGLGLSRDEQGNILGINTYPLIVDFNDGSEPVVRALFAVTPDGSAVCGGRMPLGASLTVGTFDGQAVLDTTADVLALAAEIARAKERILLIYSCIGRYFALGYNPLAEMEKTREILGDIPWSLAYSGGELCPVYGMDGTLTNRIHNDTMVICLL